MAQLREVGSPEAERVWQEIGVLLAELGVGGLSRLTWQSDLPREFGLDSLAVVELHDRLEQAFEVRLPAGVLATARTPADWLDAVLAASGAPARAAEQSGPARMRFEQPAELERRDPGTPWAESAGTLIEALGFHAQRHPNLVGVRLLGDGGATAEDLTYGTLESEARAYAQGMLTEGFEPGERVALMLPTCREYFVVSMGVLMAGGVPVPIYPPARLSVLEEHLRRQAALLDNAGASLLVTIPEARVAARLLRAQVPTLKAVRTPTTRRTTSGVPRALPTVGADDIALIQYTSGSTGDPKGVVLTHRQLLANIRAMGEAADVNSTDVFVSWLPLYHDMGLIGAWHAASLYFGMLSVFMSPLEFLARPATWLETVTRYTGTLSAAPNFAYESCVERVGDVELEGLDLSSWRLTFSGSEPVSPSTCARFAERFASCGFRPDALCPSYGLAEVGVGVTFSPLGRPPRLDTVRLTDLEQRGLATAVATDDPGGLSLVSCGVPLPGYEVRVADDEGRALPERHLGRVELRGPSATTGYFANPAATAALWDGDWLDTGDSGYLAGGELFLTGRVKDIVIRAGRNLHPEELEQALAELPGLRPDAVAVFGVADPARGTERLVAAAETELHTPGGEEALRAAVARRSLELLGVAPDEVVLLSPGSIVRTASGKIRRTATRDAYLAGTLGRRPAPVVLQLGRFAWSGLGPAVLHLARRGDELLYAAYVWALVAVIGGGTWLCLLLPLPPRARWRLTRAAGRVLAAAAGIELRVVGELPGRSSAAVLAANHPSFVDGLALLLAIPDPMVFVSSTDFERQRLAGTCLRRLGCVFVHRGQPEESERDMARLVEKVRKGNRLVVFPEGSMTAGVGLRRFHLGAFTVAALAGCPVVPVGIRGTRELVRPGSLLPRRASVEVVIGAAQLPGGEDFAARTALAEAVRRSISQLVGEPELD
ncbi:MAG TPA: AMP-binding protein [Acidimicrobiales bacterium]|nr:AMP-binding protein [Acidimicrobiales bacterium]